MWFQIWGLPLLARCVRGGFNTGTMAATITSVPSSPLSEATQLISYLYIPGTFRAAVLLPELRVSVCGQVSLCMGLLRECLGFR